MSRATVIIPFHRNVSQLGASVAAARRSLPDAEIVVVADGAVEDCRGVAASFGARVLEIAGPSGPAVARNRGAAAATGDILCFVDADVVAAPDALSGMCGLLDEEPDLAGVFGAYDEAPAASNFMSQYKNLSHAYVHGIGRPDAATFWAGLGAVRAHVFRDVGGFDERFRRPSVEDIEMGYRITGAGYRLRLDPRFRGCHLKRWTLRSAIVTDIAARGIPWAQLLRKFGGLSNDLNTRVELRASVVLAYVFLLSLPLAFVNLWAIGVGVAALVGLLLVGLPYYRWFARRRGVMFATRVFCAQLIHHWCNGVSFLAGTALSFAARAGVQLPGMIPLAGWPLTTAGSSRPTSGLR